MPSLAKARWSAGRAAVDEGGHAAGRVHAQVRRILLAPLLPIDERELEVGTRFLEQDVGSEARVSGVVVEALRHRVVLLLRSPPRVSTFRAHSTPPLLIRMMDPVRERRGREMAVSVDYRFRADTEQTPVEAGRFFAETLPGRLDARQAEIAPGASELELRDFCLEVDGAAWTLAWHGDRATVAPGNAGQAWARITTDQLSDLANDQTTPVAFMSSGVLDMPAGQLADFLNWWLVLRGALDGRRIHARGDVSLGTPVPQSFTPDDSDVDMRAFLEEAGYLHIRGLFDEDEMAAVAADYERAAPHFRKGDRRAWFATTRDGVEHLVRMEGFDAYSDVATELIDEDRFQRIGRIPGIGHVQRKVRGARVGALDKPIGVVKGISDVPWHKDCSLGRHSYVCCGLTVGISVTGADARSGQLRVVPGSHRALVWPAPCLQPGLDLEPVDLPTRTGDVTVHLSCTLHMSQPPEKQPRKVLYTGFGQRPADPAAAEAQRQKLHDVRGKAHTTVSQEPGYLGD